MTTLLPTWTLGDLELTSYPFAVEFGGDHGAPETISELVTSMLADGDLVRQTRHGNRQISIVVVVEGPTLGVVAENEAILRAECSKANNTLTFQPGDIDSPSSVFEVRLVEMRQPRDEAFESHLMHRWELTLTCSPFARSAEMVTVEALAPPGTPVAFTVNNADTTTGWTATGTAPVTVTDQGSYVQGVVSGLRPGVTLTLPFAPVDMSTTPYLRVQTSGTVPGVQSFLVELDGVWRRLLISSSTAQPDGTTLHFINVGASGTIASGLSVSSANHFPSTVTLNIHDVTRTNALAQVSPRQITRVIEVGGTERTPASLHAFTTSGFLGATVVHSTPFDGSGHSPDMRRWRATGNATSTNADARRITGTWEAMQPNPVVSRTPAHSLPRGDYVLCAAIKSDTVTTTNPLPIAWAVKSVTGGQVVGEITGTGYGWFPTAHQLTIVPIAAIAAPVVRSGALDVEVHLLNPTGTVAMHVEEWWMFKDDEDSALSIVNTAEGNLWLESPDSTSPVPTCWVGPDRALAYHPATGLISQGLHTFKPGPLMVTTISDSNDYLQAELSYFESWHSNAAR